MTRLQTRTRRLVRTAVALACVAGAAAAATGCAPAPAPAAPQCARPTSLVYVVQATDNAPTPSTPSESECALTAAVDGGVPVSVVRADGAPAALLSELTVLPGPNEASADVADRRTAAFNQIVETIASARPTKAGLDMIAALTVAGRLVRGSHPVVFVVGPGLSDSGPYDLTVPHLSLSPGGSVAEQLGASVPRLAHAEVHWFWLAQGLGDQRSLTAVQQTRIAEAYAAIVRAGGGRLVVEPGAPDASSPEVDAKGLTVRPVSPEGLQVVAVGTGVGTDVFDGRSQLAFHGDRADFLDPEAARATAEKYAVWLTAHPGSRLDVVGTTASFGTPAKLKVLSQKRAQAFCALVRAAGAPAGSIRSCTGVGKDFPEFRVDRDGQGREIVDAAQSNRSVRITRVA